MPRKTGTSVADPKLGLQWRIRTIPSIAAMVEEDSYQQFNIAIMDLQEGGSTTADIDISSISNVMERSRGGAAYSATGITQPTFLEATGRVYCSYRFLAAEWQVGDMYRLTVSGISVALTSNEVAVLPTEVWSNMVAEHAELAADVNNIDANLGDMDAAATADDLSDITTTNAHAKLRRILLRFSADAFTATVGGVARTDVENMIQGLANYFMAGGAAFSAALDGTARTDLDAYATALGVLIGARADAIPAMNGAPGTTAVVPLIKACLERIGATPADGDDSVLTLLGQRDDAAATGAIGTKAIVPFVKQLVNIFQLADADLSDILDDSPFAHLFSKDGDVSEFDDQLMSLEAIAGYRGLCFWGKVTSGGAVGGFVSTDLQNHGANCFDDWWVYVAEADDAAPQGEYRQIATYATNGTFTNANFSVALATGDQVIILHPAIYEAIASAVVIDDIHDTDLPAVQTVVDRIDNVLIPSAAVHFWVDQTAGNDSNGGLSPADPFLTITYAISQCTTGRYDVIHIMANSPSSPPGTETFPIVVDKNGVTIIAEHGKGLLTDSGIGADDDNPCIQIAAHYVTVEGMYLGIRAAGHAGGIVEFNGTNSYFGTTFRRCLFDTQYIAAYGIYLPYDQPYLLVEDCIFGGTWIAGYTTAGIYIGNCTGGMFRRNVFNKIQGIAISAGGSAGNFQILDNRFSLPSDAEGKGIFLDTGSSGIFVDGNHAAYGDTAMATNPYLDSAAAGANNWGLNYAQGVSVLPS